MNTQKEWWRGAVIYQIYPRSFLDTGGDGIGDLAGITRKMDHVASLGVDGIWLSPFFPSPMADFGYDVSDYRGVDPIFGTLRDFDAMIAAAHARGLKMIIDLVLNHTSDRHPWFAESRAARTGPKADWYVWADPKPDGTPPNNWLSVFGGPAWTFDAARGQYYMHQFLKQQPDLNVRNPAAQEALLDTAKWWLDRGVDGFRLDALPHCIQDALLRDNPPAPAAPGATPYAMQRHLHDKLQPEMIPFIESFRALTDRYDGRVLVGEVNDEGDTSVTISYTDGPKRLHTAYGFSLLGHEYGSAALRRCVEGFFSVPHAAWPSWAFSNHDCVRVASRWAAGAPSAAQAKMLTALLTSLRGTAFLYQGEELGLTEAAVPENRRQDPGVGATGGGRDGCRTPMPWDGAQKNAGFSGADETWLPVPDGHLPLCVATQEADENSTLNFTRRFLRWRGRHEALRGGDISFLDAGENLLAFRRQGEEETIICVFNLFPEEASFTLPRPCAPLPGHGMESRLTGESLTLPGFGGFFGREK